jgi:hypothetical protein
MHLSLTTPYMFRISCVSPELPHVLAHVVPTVHVICRLLVAQEVCAQSHFYCSLRGMNSSFGNVVPVSRVLKRNK